MLHVATPTVGVHLNLPEHVYHRDLVSLSSSGARRLWWSGITPRQFRHEQFSGSRDTDALEFGRAVHTLALGSGPPVVRLEFKDWKTKKAQEERARHRRAGHVPLLPRSYYRAEDMAAAFREHAAVAPLLVQGWPEVSFYWIDTASGLLLRARLDWLYPAEDGAVDVLELKTTDNPDPEEFAWSVLRYGYHLQQHWNTDALNANELTVRRYLIVAVSKHPPHVVSVIELHPEDLAEAADHNHRARRLFADCVRTDSWPAHGDGIHPIRLPRRAPARHHH